MKFSKDLLDDVEVKSRMFDSTVQKTNNFVKDIYLIDADKGDHRIKSNKVIDLENYRYGLVISIGNRNIGIGCNLEGVDDTNNMVTEVINIFEAQIDKVTIPNAGKMFYNELLDYAQTYLEDKYGLNFTPIDPDDKDSNILSIEEDPVTFYWKALFVQPYHDGHYVSKINVTERDQVTLETVINKRHKVYLE